MVIRENRFVAENCVSRREIRFGFIFLKNAAEYQNLVPKFLLSNHSFQAL
jgi:hypothetical protein